MRSGGHETIRRYIRVGTIALVVIGALAFGHEHARAQLGIDALRQAVEKAKSKGKQLPGKPDSNLQKGKQAIQKGAADALKGRLKDKSGLEKAARDKLGKDRLPRDQAIKDQLSKDKLGTNTPRDRLGKDLVKDKSPKDRLTRDKAGLGKDGKSARDLVGKDKLGKDRIGTSKIGDAKSATRSIGDRSSRLKIANAKTPVERSKVRVDHRRQIIAARLRLPPRPLPGQPGFTGVPPPTERRYVATEMVFHVGAGVSRAQVDAQAKRLGLTVVGTQTSGITGGTIYHFRLGPGRQVPDVVRSLEEERVGIAQPNYVFRITEEGQQPAANSEAEASGSSEQYVIDKLNLAEAHKIATGNGVLVAVIDSKIDASHPDLAGAIADQFDAVGTPNPPHTHGTGMVGAITAHTKLIGIAPKARILAVHAFSTTKQQSPEATTRQIIAGIDWAISKGARVINMSFAGPYDPMIQLAMKNASAKGVVLIAASGNLGPKSPPLYPAADPHVIAVTATDLDDRLFTGAVRGPHLAVAAPGVEVMVPAPKDAYQLTTGTSVAAAHVSGVVALLLERHPTANAQLILEVLTATARNLGSEGRDDQFGWGLIEPTAALQELDSRVADGKLIASAKSQKSAQEKAAPQATAAPKATAPRPAAVRTSPAP
jgi:subtilisin family serine protease